MLNVVRSVGDYEACNEALRRICGAYQVFCERWWELRGSIRTRRAGSLEFADVALSAGRVLRDRNDAHCHGEQVFLILQAAGTARMRQSGCEAVLQPGDCTLIDSRYPSVFEIGAGFRQYSFHLPAPRVAERFGAGAFPIARTIRSDRGAGALLSQLLSSATRNAPSLEGVDLTGVIVDLLASALGVRAAAPPMQSGRRALSVPEITQFVDAHIQSPELSPVVIAAHFNTSVRQLYRLVASAGWTPASLIWSRRLERARELLAQSHCRAPIIEIALTCGFKDGAHFSRAYRKAFGHPPKVARILAMAGQLPEDEPTADAARSIADDASGGGSAVSAWSTRSTVAGSNSGARRTSRVQISA